MMRLILLLFYFSLFKYLILIIGSPVFAYLSEKTEAIMEGLDHSFNWKELRKDTYRGIRLALRNASGKVDILFIDASFDVASAFDRLDHSDHCRLDGMLLLWIFHAGLQLYAGIIFRPDQSIKFTGPP